MAPSKGKGTLTNMATVSHLPMLLLALSAMMAFSMPLYVMIAGMPEPSGQFYPPQSHLTPHPRKVERPRQGVHFQPGTLHEDGRALGDEEAVNTVVEFTDFSCPHCQDAHRGMVTALLHHYLPFGRLRFESHPVAFLDNDSLRGAHAALCAQEQHKYWEMRELLFQVDLSQQKDANGGLLPSVNESEARRGNVFTGLLLKQLASAAKLDLWAFVKCFQEGRYEDEVHRISQLARDMGILETPTFLINHRKVEGLVPVSDLYAMLV